MSLPSTVLPECLNCPEMHGMIGLAVDDADVAVVLGRAVFVQVDQTESKTEKRGVSSIRSSLPSSPPFFSFLFQMHSAPNMETLVFLQQGEHAAHQCFVVLRQGGEERCRPSPVQ